MSRSVNIDTTAQTGSSDGTSTAKQTTAPASTDQRQDVTNHASDEEIRRNAIDTDFQLDSSLESIRIGVGWDRNNDLDISAMLFDKNLQNLDTVWYAKTESSCKSVRHSGDNRTGEEEGEDEVITVDLYEVPIDVRYIAFVISDYNEGLSTINNAFVRVSNANGVGQDLWSYKLPQRLSNGLLLVQLKRQGPRWRFTEIGAPIAGRDPGLIVNNSKNFVRLDTTQSEAPKMRKISIEVVEGTNLTAKDEIGWIRKVASSDPYFIITYKDKTQNSPHVSQSLNPQWKMGPIELGLVMETDPAILSIEVFDYDFAGSDESLGVFKISASRLYAFGVGEHVMRPKLQAAKIGDVVGGNLHLKLTVSDI